MDGRQYPDGRRLLRSHQSGCTDRSSDVGRDRELLQDRVLGADESIVTVRKNGPPQKCSVGVVLEGGNDTLPLLRGDDIVVDNEISIIVR